MIGFPSVLNTKQDYLNAVEYVKSDRADRKKLVRMLESLRDNIYMNVLKDSSKEKSTEDLTPDDYMAVENPNCDKLRLGISDKEIESWIKEADNE
ncbi:MAG: hypothetical protein IJ828_12475 [Treponema sp.]|nr:hypothetical protein [Treponema sp.]